MPGAIAHSDPEEQPASIRNSGRYRAGRADEKAFRARQNVVLEMGMLLARLRR